MPAPTPRKVALASAVGATIEWYDFFLYGTAAALVFDKLYFNRPRRTGGAVRGLRDLRRGLPRASVGGLIFGHFGDRIGRKQMLLLTLRDHGRRHGAHRLLPTYDQIGVWAPIPLVRAAGAAGHRRRRRVRRRGAARRGVRPRRAPVASRQLRRTSGCRAGSLAAGAFSIAGLAARRGLPRVGLARLLPGEHRAARHRRLHPPR